MPEAPVSRTETTRQLLRISFWVGNLGSGIGESAEYLPRGVHSRGGLLGTECPSLFHGMGWGWGEGAPSGGA